MNRVQKVVVKLLLALILSLCIPAVADFNIELTVYAAEKAPSLKEQKLTLYEGYKNHTLAIDNLVKGAQITYKTSNKKIATVSAKGVIKPVAAGTATVTATVKQNSRSYNLKTTVTVKAPYIKLTQTVDYLNVGESASFKVKAYGTDSEIKWSTSDTETLKISDKGKATALKAGKAAVIASAGELTAQCELDIGTNRLGSYSRNISIYNDYTVWVKVEDIYDDERLEWSTNSRNIITCNWADSFDKNSIALIIKPLKAGTDVITIGTNKSNDKLIINVTVTDKPENKKVLSAEEIYEKCGPSTVEIYAYYQDELSMGSGFYVDKGVIVTNYHVIEGAERIMVKTHDDKTVSVTKIIGFSKQLDLALLAIDKQGIPLTVSQDKVAVGQDVYAIGSPYGLTGTMSKGMVTTSSRKIENVDYIQVDASISPGNSGGPLINKYGEVIGVITMYYINGQNLNFAVNIKQLLKINTNRPMTVKEYAQLYETLFYIELIDNAVKEDPNRSQYLSSCQLIPSNTAVIGTLTAAEDWDVYKFEMEDYGFFNGFIYYKDGIGINDTYFVLMDDYDNYYFAEQDDDENILKLYDVFLIPGTYYLTVMHQKANYTGEEITYFFYTVRSY